MLKERHSVRSRSLLRATIRFYNRNVTMDCLVRDISPTGAKLELEGASILPREFELAVPQRSAVYPCELKWRRQNAAGVRFKENVDPAVAHYGEFAKARIEALEKENAALRLEVSRLTLQLQSGGANSRKAPTASHDE
jgi:PilZ domain